MDGAEEGTRDVGQVEILLTGEDSWAGFWTKDFVLRAPASARLEASVSFLQGEKRQLAKVNKEETEETEEEEVSRG